jgi:hypothetical protein
MSRAADSISASEGRSGAFILNHGVTGTQRRRKRMRDEIQKKWVRLPLLREKTRDAFDQGGGEGWGEEVATK